MTDEQRAKIRALSGCTFGPGSTAMERFVRDMQGREGELTAKQAQYLDSLCYHYRRQLARIVGVEKCERWAAEGEKITSAWQQSAARLKIERETGADLSDYWMGLRGEP